MSAELPTRVLSDLWPRLVAAGISDPLIAVEQIGYLMLLKRFELEGRDQYWARLRTCSDAALMKILSEDLIDHLVAVGGEGLSPLLDGGRFTVLDVPTVRRCLDAVDRLHPESAPPSADGENFAVLLEYAQEAVRGNEFRTPPSVAALMADLVAPKAGEGICDLATGSGGLLVEAARRVRERGDEGSFRGYDVDPGMVRVCALNLFLNGVDGRVEQANVLARDFDPGGFDVVLCAPPFGGMVPRVETNPRLSRAGNRLELQFVEVCRHLLWRRAAMLVPEAFLFGRAGPFVDVRREWLRQHALQAVVLLPPTVFESYSHIRTAILLTSSRGVTEEVWFCPLGEGEPDEAALAAELAAAPEAVRARREGRPAEGEEAQQLARRMFSSTIRRIESFGWSLFPGFYRPAESKAPVTEALDLVREIEAGETEIAEQLRQARQLLEQPR